MNIQRFTAPTSREALAKARQAFGDGTLILSNRPTSMGIEVVATAEDALSELGNASKAVAKKPSRTALPGPGGQAPAARKRNLVEEDADQLSMSTLSFQDYVRERMLKRRQEGRSEQLPEGFKDIDPKRSDANSVRPASLTKNSRGPSIPTHQNTTRELPDGIHSIANELHAMKALIEDRFNTLTWLGQARQDPTQSNLMLKLIRSGFSPALTRSILQHLPANANAQESLRWVSDILERNLKTDADEQPMHEEGGVFALIGATGVGKTTTAAKLAGICARVHGASSVGLITLDTYRVGAHEQLRTYGRMLGVVAHLAHDRAALQDLLNLLATKKMVLIDTTGLAPRDPRRTDMLDVLDIPSVKRVQVLNAGSHGDTIDEIVGAYKSTGSQQAILSKTDEAVKLGPVLDAVIRHQLRLRGVTTGQRVPEDWESANTSKLIRIAMQTLSKSAFEPSIDDLGFIFTPPSIHSECDATYA